MPVLDEGNMKRFHDLFMKYYPMLLMFKEKFALNDSSELLVLATPGGQQKTFHWLNADPEFHWL